MSTVLTVTWLSVHSNSMLAAMTVFIFLAVIPTVPKMFSKFESPELSSQIRLSEDKNIILISFDGLPGHTIKGILDADPILREQFKDFTFYENVAATAPGTNVSQMGIIHGNHDFTNWNIETRINWEELYFNDVSKYDFYTLYSFNKFNKHGKRFSMWHLGPSFQLAEISHFYDAVLLRIATKHGVILFQKLKGKLIGGRHPRYTRSVDNFDQSISMMTKGNERFGVVYMHFGFTHYPITIDENCIDRSIDADWVYANSNEPGIINSSRCAMSKNAELIQKLKAIGVYENSLILLISDHGKPSTYYQSPPYNYHLNGHKLYGFDRYLPLMMIKGIDVKQDAIQYNQNHVILDDIAQTTCYAIERKETCELTAGVNLLDPNDRPPTDYFIHVPKNGYSSYKIETQKPVRLSREIPLLDAMRESEEIILSE
jgi:hypothetical protein